jgi:hypothetical protein
MKRILSYKLFESVEENNDKYILNLSSANSVLGVEAWISKSPRITDSIKASAEKGWSLYAMLHKMTLPARLGRLSNKDIGEQIRVTGIRPMRIREEYDEVCKQLLPQFHKLFNKFKRLTIEKKVDFMIEIEVEGYTICPSGDIIKIIDKKDLEYELDVISSIFEYFLLEE